MEIPQEESAPVADMFIAGLRRTEQMREEIDEMCSVLNGLAVQICAQIPSWCCSVQREIRLAEIIRRDDILKVTIRRKGGERFCVQKHWSGKRLDMERVWQVHSELNKVLELFLSVFPELRGKVSAIQKIARI